MFACDVPAFLKVGNDKHKRQHQTSSQLVDGNVVVVGWALKAKHFRIAANRVRWVLGR